MGLIGDDGTLRRARAQQIRRALLHGLLRCGSTRSGTLERLGTGLGDEPRGVGVAVLQVVDEGAALAFARLALFLLRATYLFCPQLSLAALGIFLLLQGLRV